jgi:hypothetical protein
MKLLLLFLFLPLTLYCQSPLEQEFLQFYNRMLEYKDSIGHDEQFVYPLDLSELSCKDWKELWFVENPGRKVSQKTGKELCQEWKELQKRSARKGTLFPFDINWAVQLVGDRYLVFTDQNRIASISQGKTWYFLAHSNLTDLSSSYRVWMGSGIQGGPFPFSDKLELVRDRHSQVHQAFRKLEELSMYSSFRLPLSNADWNRWKLTFYKESGWEEIVGNYHSQYHRLYTPTEESIHYGKDLYKLFPLRMERFQKEADNSRIGIPARNDPANGQWQAWKIKEDVLMVRLYHSYPDGNQTSWYHEKVYYFEKTKR